MNDFDLKKYLSENNLIKEDGEFQREYQNVQVTIKELEENRVKLTRLYAQLANNNEYSRKIYDAMDAMIDQGRDNIASNWKEDLNKYDEEHSYLMSQINEALEKDKSLREKIK
jgi:predicted nuclease with TOPRIM domain